MIIAYDKAIPHIEELIVKLTAKQPLSAASIAFTASALPAAPACLAKATVLIVRSVTAVTENLLSYAPRLRHVVSATSGNDHIEQAALTARNIALTTTQGSNANAVKEYVLNAFFHYLKQNSKPSSAVTAAVIGCGQVGGRVVRALVALGVNVIAYDPPLLAQHRTQQHTQALSNHPLAGNEHLFTADALTLTKADFITLHIPLITAKIAAEQELTPTVKLIDETFIANCKQKPFLVNTARGEVCDAAALLAARRAGKLSGLALDVWPAEPAPPPELIAAAAIATPHIAGYSVEAGVRTITQLGRICATISAAITGSTDMLPPFTLPPLPAAPCLQPASQSPIPLPAAHIAELETLTPAAIAELANFTSAVIASPYLTQTLQAAANSPRSERAAKFQSLRKTMRARREWSAYPLPKTLAALTQTQ